MALYGPPPPPPSSAARAGELAFDLADNVYDRDAGRGLRESRGGGAPALAGPGFSTHAAAAVAVAVAALVSGRRRVAAGLAGRRAVARSVAAAVTRDARFVAPGENTQVVEAAVVAPKNAAGLPRGAAPPSPEEMLCRPRLSAALARGGRTGARRRPRVEAIRE